MNETHDVQISHEDLPLWMRQAQRGTDWGIFIVLGFCLLACLPFWIQDGLPQTNDSEHYVYLGHDYATTLSEGRLYPRWSAHVQGGYGAPIPNFIPPLTPYTSAFIQTLFTNNSVDAIRIVYILAMCLAGIMTYVFVARISGSQAGILISLLYIYSPYLVLTAPHINGDLPAMIAMGLLPSILWSTNRLLTINNSFDIFLTSISLSALILTDTRFIPIGLLFILALFIHHVGTMGIRKSRGIQLGISIVLSLGITSFFWIPAILEQEHIHWVNNISFSAPTQLSWYGLIEPIRQIDLAELKPQPQFTLGFPILIFSLLSIPLSITFRKTQTLSLVFTLMGLGLAIFGISSASEATWLVGPIALCLAIGCTPILKLNICFSKNISQLYPILLYILVLAGNYPAWISPKWENQFENLTPESQIIYEQNGHGIAILPSIWNLPTTISSELESNRFLLASYDSNQIINHISSDQISAQSEAQIRTNTSHSDQFEICITQPTSFNISRAFFPGWTATIDDDSGSLALFCPRVDSRQVTQVTAIPNEQNGLLQVNIPGPSRGTLVLNFGATDVRQGSWIISWVSVIVLTLATITRIRKNKEQFYTEFELITLAQVRMSTVVLIGFGATLLLFTTSLSPFTMYAVPLHSLSNAIAIQQRTDVGMELLTYDFNQTQFRANDVVEIDLSWRTTRPLRENYRVQIHLTDMAQNIRWRETDYQIPGGYPTSRWETTRFIRDTYQLTIPDSIPIGEYQIAVEILLCRPNCATGPRIIFFDDNRQSIGQTLYLPRTISIQR